MPAKGRAVTAWSERFCDFLSRHDRTYGHPSAQGLGHGHDIRLNAVIHIAHRLPGSHPSGLHFIQQKEDAFFFREFPQPLQKLLRGGVNTAFTLHRLHHNGNRVVIHCILEGLQVIVVCIDKSIRHGTKPDLAAIVRLSCGRHGSEGPSMESHLSGHDFILLRSIVFDAVFAGHLDHGLIGFRPGVLVENLVKSGNGADLFCQQRLRNRIGIVEGMHQLTCLFLDGPDHLVITGSGGIHCDPCIEIEIRCPFLIVDVLVLRGFSQQIEPFIGFNHVL